MHIHAVLLQGFEIPMGMSPNFRATLRRNFSSCRWLAQAHFGLYAWCSCRGSSDIDMLRDACFRERKSEALCRLAPVCRNARAGGHHELPCATELTTRCSKKYEQVSFVLMTINVRGIPLRLQHPVQATQAISEGRMHLPGHGRGCVCLRVCRMDGRLHVIFGRVGG